MNNLWGFIEIYAVFVLNLCGEKSVWRKSLWRKNDEYEVCLTQNLAHKTNHMIIELKQLLVEVPVNNDF